MQISPDRKRRQDALRQRLLSFRRDWTVADLGRLAFSIAANRKDAKNWKNDRSAVQSLVRFVNGNKYLSVWTELATENLVLYLEQERDQKRRSQKVNSRMVAGVAVEPGSVAGVEIQPDILLVADTELAAGKTVELEELAQMELEFPDGPDLENGTEKLSDLFMKVAIRLEELGL